MNTDDRDRRALMDVALARWLTCSVLVLGLGAGKALADEHERGRRDQQENPQGPQGQHPHPGQQPQGQQHPQAQQPQQRQQPPQHQQPPQVQHQQPQQVQHQQPPQVQHQQPPQVQHQQPQQQRPQQGWGGQRPGERHEEHPPQGMQRQPAPPVQHGRGEPEMPHPGRPMQPAPPPRYEHDRPMHAPPPPHAERGRPMPAAPAPRFERARPMPPMHMGRPLAPREPVYVEMAPPRPRHEMRPPRPSPGYVWIGGYWGIENGAQVWIGGEWAEPPQPGYAWESPRWRRHGHRWEYVPGYWRHRGGPVYVAPMGDEPAYGGGITISGRVMSMQGAPVPGIMITLAGTQEGHIVTDGSGTYVFSGLPPGSYAVRPTGDCAFAPDVANLNDLYGSVTQDIIVSGCGGW